MKNNLIDWNLKGKIKLKKINWINEVKIDTE